MVVGYFDYAVAPLNMTREFIFVGEGLVPSRNLSQTYTFPHLSIFVGAVVYLRPQTPWFCLKAGDYSVVILTPQFYHRVILSAVEKSHKNKRVAYALDYSFSFILKFFRKGVEKPFC